MTGFAFFRLGLEEEGTVDDDLLAGTKTREDFDFASEVTTATNTSDFEVAGVLR